MGILPDKPKKKNLSKKDLSRLDNNDVPVLPLKKALKEFRQGNYAEADRLWNLIKDENRKNK